MKKDVTVVLTSCCRFDLLERTIDSFMWNNDYPIKKYILIDDGEDKYQHKQILDKYSGQFQIIIEGHIGHPACVDRAYKEVKTDYVFHVQDDWQFENGGFIQQLINILEDQKNIGLVWIRRNDLDHPFESEIYSTSSDIKFQKPVKGWLYNDPGYHDEGWFGFTFNPGLRRMKDYINMKPLSQYGSEKRCGWAFRDLGLEAAVLLTNHVKHIGWNRSKI